MHILKVTREKKFAGALMPYWIITKTSKAEFRSKYGLDSDICEQSESGFPIPRIEMGALDEIGTRIGNGETVEIEIDDHENTMFVSTMDGYLSNEISTAGYIDQNIPVVITTKGGFRFLPYPVIKEI